MRKGFTLVELLIVIIIIGILATMAVPQYNKMVNRAKTTEGIMMIGSILNGFQLYYTQTPTNSTVDIDVSKLDVTIGGGWTGATASGIADLVSPEGRYQLEKGSLKVRGRVNPSTGTKKIEYDPATGTFVSAS